MLKGYAKLTNICWTTNQVYIVINLPYIFIRKDTVKTRKEETKKLGTNRLFFKILYPLDMNQCQAVSGKCS